MTRAARAAAHQAGTTTEWQSTLVRKYQRRTAQSLLERFDDGWELQPHFFVNR